MDAAPSWDEKYRNGEMTFSGTPNPVLISEASDLRSGTALDVGCGDGADARWLAQRGWQVTVIDVSVTALTRAAAVEPHISERVTWTEADLMATPPDGVFDLVSLQYFPLMHQPGDPALRGLLGAVAPGGTLLFATHALAGLTPGPGFDPSAYYQPDEIVGLLGDDWVVLTNETRPRATPTPAGTHHTHDVVLRAQRTTGEHLTHL